MNLGREVGSARDIPCSRWTRGTIGLRLHRLDVDIVGATNLLTGTSCYGHANRRRRLVVWVDRRYELLGDEDNGAMIQKVK